MLPTHLLRRKLSDFDAAASDLMRDGGRESDLDRLDVLAKTLAADTRRWRDIVDGLEGAAGARLNPGRVLAIILESVFDEVLSAPAWRVLAANLALGDVSAS